jgi:hypothetical protein
MNMKIKCKTFVQSMKHCPLSLRMVCPLSTTSAVASHSQVHIVNRSGGRGDDDDDDDDDEVRGVV